MGSFRMWGRADMATHTACAASGGIDVGDVGKTKALARGILRAQFFDEQGIGQGG